MFLDNVAATTRWWSIILLAKRTFCTLFFGYFHTRYTRPRQSGFRRVYTHTGCNSDRHINIYIYTIDRCNRIVWFFDPEYFKHKVLLEIIVFSQHNNRAAGSLFPGLFRGACLFCFCDWDHVTWFMRLRHARWSKSWRQFGRFLGDKKIAEKSVIFVSYCFIWVQINRKCCFLISWSQ
jgi:hypothetical protein